MLGVSVCPNSFSIDYGVPNYINEPQGQNGSILHQEKVMKKGEVFWAPNLYQPGDTRIFQHRTTSQQRAGNSRLQFHSGHHKGSPSKKILLDFGTPAGNRGVFASVKCLLAVVVAS